ncbi:hypothetical protein D3875_11850 [Deinococcus cavernae]|uniref:HRDC domain-containing protein n=1 Tax=Deinococcus cavernae TaxID=2320857 RepID=A0A418V7T9_9DEIO|nr:HRDC domain-containing protein [Deinococcus cavernae]RJF72140.1 hypothetical protein D3875_11850 [Deinococcus cavernae]
MTESRSLRPDARLVQLHAERGDPLRLLAQALAALEEADWGLLFSGEAALARQLVALLGPGTLRVDGRLNLSRGAFAEAGLAVADLHGDLGGARAVWLFEPDARTLERAARAGVKVIVDATLAPGGGWPERGADYVVYRNAATVSGHTDVQLAALFGLGRAPEPAAPAPDALSAALALRDVATLPLRLARSARTVSNVAERLGGAAREAGPTALLLMHDAAPDTLTPLGGVLAAARHVPDGLLLTPGLQDTDTVLALLRDPQEQEREPRELEQPQRPAERPQQERREDRRDERREEKREMPRRFERRSPRESSQRDGSVRDTSPREGGRDQNRGERPQADRPSMPDRQNRPDRAQPDELQRFTFEAAPNTDFDADPRPTDPQPQETQTGNEEVWEPEIVFSDLEHSAPPLTHTVSNGPDAADQRSGVPDVLGPGAARPAADLADAGDAAPTVQPSAATVQAAHMVEEHTPNPEPDLPAAPAVSPGTSTDTPAKEDPAANLTDEQAAIYARLREWRNAEAKRQEISRFIIASNASLAEIARRVPYTLDDLAAVRGMGKARLEKYGEKILAVVRN